MRNLGQYLNFDNDTICSVHILEFFCDSEKGSQVSLWGCYYLSGNRKSKDIDAFANPQLNYKKSEELKGEGNGRQLSNFCVMEFLMDMALSESIENRQEWQWVKFYETAIGHGHIGPAPKVIVKG